MKPFTSLSSALRAVPNLLKAIMDSVSANYLIPTWVLTTFNDYYNQTSESYVDNITLNAELRVVSHDSSDILDSMDNIQYCKGFDKPERLTQG